MTTEPHNTADLSANRAVARHGIVAGAATAVRDAIATNAAVIEAERAIEGWQTTVERINATRAEALETAARAKVDREPYLLGAAMGDEKAKRELKRLTDTMRDADQTASDLEIALQQAEARLKGARQDLETAINYAFVPEVEALLTERARVASEFDAAMQTAVKLAMRWYEAAGKLDQMTGQRMGDSWPEMHVRGAVAHFFRPLTQLERQHYESPLSMSALHAGERWGRWLARMNGTAPAPQPAAAETPVPAPAPVVDATPPQPSRRRSGPRTTDDLTRGISAALGKTQPPYATTERGY